MWLTLEVSRYIFYLFVCCGSCIHDDVIKWKIFPRYWLIVRGIHRSPVSSPHKASDAELWWFFFICASINGWVNNREAGNLKLHRTHYDVIAMKRLGSSVRVNDPVLSDTDANLKLFNWLFPEWRGRNFTSAFFELMSLAHPVKSSIVLPTKVKSSILLPTKVRLILEVLVECRETLLLISQHWFR